MMRDGSMTPSTSNATLFNMEVVLETQTDLYSELLVKRPAFRLTVFLFVSSRWMADLAEGSFSAGFMTIRQESVKTLPMVGVKETRTGSRHRMPAKIPAITRSRSWKPQRSAKSQYPQDLAMRPWQVGDLMKPLGSASLSISLGVREMKITLQPEKNVRRPVRMPFPQSWR